MNTPTFVMSVPQTQHQVPTDAEIDSLGRDVFTAFIALGVQPGDMLVLQKQTPNEPR